MYIYHDYAEHVIIATCVQKSTFALNLSCKFNTLVFCTAGFATDSNIVLPDGKKVKMHLRFPLFIIYIFICDVWNIGTH